MSNSLESAIKAAAVAVVGLVVALVPDWSAQAHEFGALAAVLIPLAFQIAASIEHRTISQERIANLQAKAVAPIKPETEKRVTTTRKKAS